MNEVPTRNELTRHLTEFSTIYSELSTIERSDLCRLSWYVYTLITYTILSLKDKEKHTKKEKFYIL